ncbi:hypothetical protein SF12_15465 [Streptomyces sp. MBRL 601]|nr:hypothetical protein SF12_15465 [Streptomyces sp. MBRL 601]
MVVTASRTDGRAGPAATDVRSGDGAVSACPSGGRIGEDLADHRCADRGVDPGSSQVESVEVGAVS